MWTSLSINIIDGSRERRQRHKRRRERERGRDREGVRLLKLATGSSTQHKLN